MNIKKFETNFKKKKYLEESNHLVFEEDKYGLETELINIYPDVSYQEFLGFGGAFTESAGYALSQTSQDVYNQVMQEYFAEDGLRYTLCRTHINSCDFSLNNYAYLENNDIRKFSISRDKKYLIPMIQTALRINNNIKLLASPWSPPAFMKTNHNMNEGGKLLDEYKQFWANYLIQYIKEYKKENINIDYITVQNEPKAKQTWESCLYSSNEESDFVNNYLFPTFYLNGISTKILVWDHNKERVYERANEIMQDKTSNTIDGFAYHWYSGDYFENISLLREKYPNKLLFHTEGCTGYSKFKKKDEIKNAEIYAHDIIGDINAGSNGFIDWNMVLDYKGGPNHKNNYCNSPIMINKKKNGYIKNLSFYYISHFSKFIDQKAKRIAFSKYTNKLEVTALKNFDNSIIIVLLNPNDFDLNYVLRLDTQLAKDTIKAHSILTVILKGANKI